METITLIKILDNFAELILLGKKQIELRTWNSKFRGKFYVNASGNLYTKEMYLKNKDKHCAFDLSWFSQPLFDYILKNPKQINPIPYKGVPGFFNIK